MNGNKNYLSSFLVFISIAICPVLHSFYNWLYTNLNLCNLERYGFLFD